MVLFEIGVDDFECIVVGESNLTYVVERVRNQGKEMMRCVDNFSGGFIEILPKLAPEAVEHGFGSGLPSGVLDNETGIEVDAFSQFVLLDVPGFVGGSGGPGGVAGGFLFNFEPSVDVLGKESIFTLFGWEMVNLVDLDEGVPQLDGFLDLGVHHSPRSVRCSGVCRQTHDFSSKGLDISSSMQPWQSGNVSLPLCR